MGRTIAVSVIKLNAHGLVAPRHSAGIYGLGHLLLTHAMQQCVSSYHVFLVGAGEPVSSSETYALLPGRLIEDQAEQEMHVAAVGSAFRRLGSIGPPHLAQVPYVPSDIRFRAASI